LPHGMDWVLSYISAVGEGTLGKSMLELEEFVVNSAGGVHISSENLISLAESLKDLDRIELVGSLDERVVARLMCFDSSTWSIEYEPGVISVREGAWAPPR